MKLPVQLQNQNVQLQHPYRHHISQNGNQIRYHFMVQPIPIQAIFLFKAVEILFTVIIGKHPSLMLDAARLSNDPQKATNESEGNTKHLQRAQTSLALPLDRYHYPGNIVTSAAMVHHNHPTPMNPQHFLEPQSNNMFQVINPNVDSATGRLTLSTFSPSNPNFPGPGGFQVRILKLCKV